MTPLLRLCPLLFALSWGQALDVAITACGAVADGTTVNTVAIQKAIDAVAAGGGGQVIVPKGRFVTGTLYLKSHVRVHLDGEAVLLGSRDLADYPTNNPGSGEIGGSNREPTGEVLTTHHYIQALIVADGQRNVGIDGAGIIDGRGQGDAFPVRLKTEPGAKPKLGQRPMLMRFHRTAGIRLEGVTTKDPASWGIHLVDCDDVHVRGITARHRSNENNDGIDIDGCRNVFISDCDLSSGDDTICPKSSFGRPTENLFVRGCILSSDTAAVKFGTSSRAGFRNVIISDCVMRDCRMGAIKILCVDGGTIENVLIQNILMERVEGPLFIRLGDRGAAYQTPEPGDAPVPVGILRDITISNVRATVTTTDRARSGIMITGIPGHPVRGIRLDNIDLRFPGLGPVPAEAKPVPEDEKRYPEQFFFGPLPSYGAYIRHAEDIEMTRIRISHAGEEQRPAIVLDDVAGFTLRDSRIQGDGASIIDVSRTTGLTVGGCTLSGRAAALVAGDEPAEGQWTVDGNRLSTGMTVRQPRR